MLSFNFKIIIPRLNWHIWFNKTAYEVVLIKLKNKNKDFTK